MATVVLHSGMVGINVSSLGDRDANLFFQSLLINSKATSQVTSACNGLPPRPIEGKTLPSMDRLTSSSSSQRSSVEPCSSCIWSRSSSSNSHGSLDDEFLLRLYSAPGTAEIRRVFERFDENKDGLICCKDLHRFMKRLGFKTSEEEAKSMLKSVDDNDDGKVDFDEFYSLYKSLSDDEWSPEDEADEADDEDDTLLQAFKVFDKNDDGVITAQELQTVLLDLGLVQGKSLKNCERMIQGVDSGGNGQIDITAFKRMMCSRCFQM